MICKIGLISVFQETLFQISEFQEILLFVSDFEEFTHSVSVTSGSRNVRYY